MLAVLLVLAVPSAATAQQVLALAQAGEPFGVATIEIPLAAGVPIGSLPPLRVTDAQRRVFYPVGQEVRQKLIPPSERPVPEAGQGRLLRRVGKLIREITSKDQPTEETIARRISFLFQGNEPMVVALSDTSGVIGEYQLNPEPNPAMHAQLLDQWWTDYTAAAKTRIDAGDYPPWVETYLVAMLSGRLHLPMPAWFTAEAEAQDTLVSTLKLMAGAEQATEAMYRQAAMGQPIAPDMSRVVSVPAAPRWTEPIPIPNDANDNTAIEPLATRVPPECFYIRYGSFENYLWFRDLSEEYGGDVSRMVTLRGFRSPGTKAI
ncbi:putative secreted protein, partial [Rhodopirellula maiorica SM1]